jgi:hypothetical protein
MRHPLLAAGLLLLSGLGLKGQDISGEGQLHGNFQIDMQSYTEDSSIGATKVPEYVLMNAYGNFVYTKGGFTAGVRYEAYLNTMLGYDAKYNGQGIPHKFASYKTDEYEITAGSFYEQFGSGLVLRSYEEKTLGIDNAFNGFRIKGSPYKGINLTGLVGKQRYFFDLGQGIVRGVDGEINFNETFTKLSAKKTMITIGGSFVSKFQADKDPVYNLPENVGAAAGRMNIQNGPFAFMSEYAYKINDPSSDNNYIYKDGQAMLVNTSYSKKGLGILLAAKWLDNMSYRSDRNATITNLQINYLPAINKPYTWAMSNMYPFATQANGEFGLQGEIMYKFKKESLLGGKYGTNVTLGYCRVTDIEKKQINDTIAISEPGTLGYSSDFATMGSNRYYEEISFEVNKKINSSLITTFLYQNISYNYDILRGMTGHGMVYAHVAVADVTWKMSKTKALRLEQEYLISKQDHGNWVMYLLEYSVAPKWFITIWDQYNLGNDHYEAKNYLTGSVAFIHKGSRFQVGYGRQREGVICVGGVCRNVPASNGFILSISSTF